MVHVAVAGSYASASLGKRLHRSHADMRLFGILRPGNRLRHQPKQRALSAAVRLLQGQLLVDKIPFWHILNIFSATSGAVPGWWMSVHPAVPVVQGQPTQRA